MGPIRSMSSIRETLLRQAVFELEVLLEASPDGDSELRREELETLIDHLKRGILSPVVLDAVATAKPRREVA